MKLLAVVPTYNERDTLPRLAEAVLALPLGAHLLVVDDASPDGTGEEAERLARASDGRLHVLHRAGRMGLGTAYLDGFRWGLARDYDLLAETDADFSHNPADLPRLLAAVEAGADLALGSRYVPGGATPDWGLLRRLISRGGNLYARAILRSPIHDLTGGFKLFRRRVLEAIPLDQVRSEGYAFQIEMTYRALTLGFRVVEVPIVFEDRRVGQSKMTWGIVAEALLRVPEIRIVARQPRGR